MIDCAVIGGGIAGLSAAVRLAAHDRSVALFEARPRPGGRAYAFRDSATGEMIDNGQHILMGCYKALLDYMETVGTRDRLTPIRNMRVPFLSPKSPPTVLQAAPLPWPLDALSAFLGFRALSLTERLSLLRVVAKAAFMQRDSMHVLDSISVADWLRKCGQGDAAIAKLWEPIVLATMNAKLDEASAFLFVVVLKDAFLAGKEAATFLVPDTDLSALLANPGVAFIERNGGSVQLHTCIDSIEQNGDVWILHSGGRQHTARTVICALPPKAYAALAAQSPALAALGVPTGAFQPSLILSAHLWTRAELTRETMTGFHDTTSQWIFPRGQASDGTYRYAVVVSAANALRSRNNDVVQAGIVYELCEMFESFECGDVVRVKIVREHAATFLPKPGLEALRPQTRTSRHGLFLAGDWTAVSLPATLEGAARSGHRAAQEVLRFLQPVAVS